MRARARARTHTNTHTLAAHATSPASSKALTTQGWGRQESYLRPKNSCFLQLEQYSTNIPRGASSRDPCPARLPPRWLHNPFPFSKTQRLHDSFWGSSSSAQRAPHPSRLEPRSAQPLSLPGNFPAAPCGVKAIGRRAARRESGSLGLRAPLEPGRQERNE